MAYPAVSMKEGQLSDAQIEGFSCVIRFARKGSGQGWNSMLNNDRRTNKEGKEGDKTCNAKVVVNRIHNQRIEEVCQNVNEEYGQYKEVHIK